MRLYYEIAVRAFKRATAYRSAYVAGILTNAFFGALICFVYQAVYRSSAPVAGLTLSDAISYTWATQSLISIGAGWISSTEISQSIRSGDVATDLYRPWSFLLYWFSRSLGERAFNLLFRGSLTYLIGVLYFGARLPAPSDLLAFLPAMVLSLIISFGFSFCVNVSAFWLLDNSGVIMLASVLLTFFSGFLLPLAYFPPALQALAYALPFQAITSLPTRIFLGLAAGPEIAAGLLVQLLWAAAFLALCLLMQAAAMRKLVVQGG